MHHIKPIILSFLLTHLFIFSKAQTVGVGGWILTLNTYKIKKSLSIYFDGQFRTTNQFENVQTLILRPGLQVNIRKNINATLGYAFVENRRTMGNLSGYLPEHRIWEQLQVMHTLGFTSLNHRFRLEQRFIPKVALRNNSLQKDGTNYANRFRYFFRDIIPLNGTKAFKKGAFTVLQNEIFINIGDKSSVNGKYFDQNRAYLAIGYRFSPKFDLEGGYLNQYISGQDKSTTNNHNIQVASYIRL